jgi:transposase
MKNKRDNDEFDAAKLELEELTEQHKNGDIELWSFDESGFDLQPSVPYAWQPVGKTIEVPSNRSKRLNVLGFLTPDNDLESFCFEGGTVDTDVVVACFDKFAARKTSKPRIVIIDNASTHTNAEFVIHLKRWEKKGVIVRSLPTYCSELNLIEILWRFIKYHWLPFSAYLSLDNLRTELDNILKNFGSEFIINFAD